MDDEIEACYERGWTDGLPVVPPTRARVDRMLAGRDPAGEIARLPPGGGLATLEKVAANAVMAGCRPEHFPVVLAAVRAVARREFDLEGVVTTVHSAAPLVLVEGPVARELGMNGGAGVLGPGNRANATIGRALQLCLRNIAGGRAGGLDAATLAHPGKYTYCFAESPDSPWPPLAVERGFGPDESTVTVYAADAPLCLVDKGRGDPESVLRTIAASVAIPGTYNALFRRELWLVMGLEHARICARAGWTRADVCSYLHEHARLSADELRDRGLHGAGIAAPWLDGAAPDERLPIVERPEQVVVAVAGGPYGNFTAAIFGTGTGVTERVT